MVVAGGGVVVVAGGGAVVVRGGCFVVVLCWWVSTGGDVVVGVELFVGVTVTTTVDTWVLTVVGAEETAGGGVAAFASSSCR